MDPADWHRHGHAFFTTTDGYSGAPLFGLGFRFLTGPIIDAGSGGLALGIDLGVSIAFASGDAYVLGLPLSATLNWVQSLGGAQLLARGGVHTPLNYSFTTGANGVWSLDLLILGVAGIGFVIPNASGPKWLLGADVLFGGGDASFLFTAGVRL